MAKIDLKTVKEGGGSIQECYVISKGGTAKCYEVLQGGGGGSILPKKAL